MRTVLERAPELLVCPLDVTARMVVPDDELAAVFAVAPILAEQCATWADAPVCLHDPLALLALMGEPHVSTRPGRVDVDDDGRAIEHARGHECEVVEDVEVTAAIARIHDLIAHAEAPSQ